MESMQNTFKYSVINETGYRLRYSCIHLKFMEQYLLPRSPLSMSYLDLTSCIKKIYVTKKVAILAKVILHIYQRFLSYFIL